jgi:hypothetical protein
MLGIVIRFSKMKKTSPLTSRIIGTKREGKKRTGKKDYYENVFK